MSGPDVYQIVTDRILEMLDTGTVPWRHPIRGRAPRRDGSDGNDLGGGDWPRNIGTGRPYRGINVFLLAVTSWLKGYGSSFWLTYRQAAERGGNVRKGEKSSMIVFWRQYQTTDKQTGEAVQRPVLRYYRVFNADQCEGIGTPDAPAEPAAPFEPIEQAERIAKGYPSPPSIRHSGTQAFYRPSADLVQMPEPGRFLSREFYYATLFHELAHSTGHSSRLDRGLDRDLRPFGSPDYSKEELIAEMGSAFLCATAGIGPPTIEQSAAYIAGWRKSIASDRRLIIAAAGAGQRAADWILGNRLQPGGNQPDAAMPDETAGPAFP